METRSKNAVICCGFTPCIQRILEFPVFRKGQVNRSTGLTLCIGGKGANTARQVKQLGGQPRLIGFAGGANGRLLEKMLRLEGIAFDHVETAGETRICQTLVETGNPETTELVEEMPAVTADEWAAMLRRFESETLSNSIVTLSGKLPAGLPDDAYARMIARIARQGGEVILDAPGEPMRLALEHRPFMVKINDEELLSSIGGADVPSACRRLLEQGARSVLITRGSRSAFYFDDRRALELHPPVIKAVNPVGSGDAVTAGLAFDLSRGRSVTDALITGMACGAANALNLISGFLKRDDVERLRSFVQVMPI